MKKNSNRGKSIAILGGGESGVGAAILAKEQGWEVFLSDGGNIADRFKGVLAEEKIAFEEGAHSLERILDADVFVKSPGIPDKASIIISIKEIGGEIVSEIEFASWYTDAKIVAVTGSNGKTTTSLLTYHLLKSAGLNVGLAGNIGDSFALQVARKKFDYYVLEISSFQLDNILHFRPDIAIILNITPDHLDRYDYSIEKYTASKFNLIRNQTKEDFLIYFKDKGIVESELDKRKPAVQAIPVSLDPVTFPGGFLWDGYITVGQDGSKAFSEVFDSFPINGAHNAINSMCAIMVAQLLKIENQSILCAIQTFVNAPHRLEKVRELNGITYINDSKATNVDSVYYALGSFNRPIVWIAGGVDKGNDYAQIDALVKQKVKALVILAKAPEKLLTYFKGKVGAIEITEDLSQAVRLATDLAEAGDVILLSPACASFDLFKNYEDRGDRFREAVQKL